ncbi:hypothetical protein PVAND_011106 [Polypedilum vanderplanki]|uniref:Uncharacterized protein n=2 Tax=Polypedilum vanderplanki TaxID=319348 RepID=A0A9J6CII2_POLVA|nr:hypothetical protein PVAND_011106 [Polypedilum vanderplanki]
MLGRRVTRSNSLNFEVENLESSQTRKRFNRPSIDKEDIQDLAKIITNKKQKIKTTMEDNNITSESDQKKLSDVLSELNINMNNINSNMISKFDTLQNNLDSLKNAVTVELNKLNEVIKNVSMSINAINVEINHLKSENAGIKKEVNNFLSMQKQHEECLTELSALQNKHEQLKINTTEVSIFNLPGSIDNESLIDDLSRWSNNLIKYR